MSNDSRDIETREAEAETFRSRLAALDFALGDWVKGRFPNLAKFLRGTKVYFREVNRDVSLLHLTDEEANDPALKSFNEASKFSGMVYVAGTKEQLRLWVYHRKGFKPSVLPILLDTRGLTNLVAPRRGK